MGQRKPNDFSNLTLITLKTHELDKTSWQNPYKTFRKGALPIGLAHAFHEKYRYDGLRASQICIWLGHLRCLTYQWTPITFISLATWFILPVSSSEVIKGEFVDKLHQYSFVHSVVGLHIFLLTAFVLTRKSYKRNKERMYDFMSKIHDFVCAFRPLLTRKPAAVWSSMDKQQLREVLQSDMAEHAIAILQGEVIGTEPTLDRQHRRAKSAAANDFGIGNDWSVYFDAARAKMGKGWQYEAFAWEI